MASDDAKRAKTTSDDAAKPTSQSTPSNIDRACSFLLHQDTQSTPLRERLDFLQRKGVSEVELKEALARCKLMPPPAGPAAEAKPRRAT